MTAPISRFFHVPLRHRALHLINTVSVQCFGRWMGISHVIEYPKCGGSWIRRMIQTYIGGRPYLHDRLVSRGTVIQLHRRYRRAFHRPVVVVRDARDMYVSAYYHDNFFEHRVKHPAVAKYFQHDPNRPLRDDFSQYLKAKILNTTEPRFFYSQFLDSWLNRPGVCLIRYEDCLHDAEAQLIRIVRFLDRPIDMERIKQAVSMNRFEDRTKEASGQSRKPGEADPTQFARKGIAGDWRNHFNRQSCHLLEKVEGGSLRRLGYESNGSWVDQFLNEGNAEQLSTLA